jgi:hypothetical protein
LARKVATIDTSLQVPDEVRDMAPQYREAMASEELDTILRRYELTSIRTKLHIMNLLYAHSGDLDKGEKLEAIDLPLDLGSGGWS